MSTGQRELREATLGDLIRAIAAPYVPAGRLLDCEGPKAILPESAMTPLGLILNELATNALKYGGWSLPQGTVSTRWAFEMEDADRAGATLRWSETGSGQVATSAHAGFGMTMIELSASQANATLERW